MFNWIKRLLGFTEEKREPLVLTDPIKYEDEIKVQERPPEPKPTKPKKKTSKKKSVDLDSMTKTQLLAEAKKRGIKANASLKKNEILDRLNAQ